MVNNTFQTTYNGKEIIFQKKIRILLRNENSCWVVNILKTYPPQDKNISIDFEGNNDDNNNNNGYPLMKICLLTYKKVHTLFKDPQIKTAEDTLEIWDKCPPQVIVYINIFAYQQQSKCLR